MEGDSLKVLTILLAMLLVLPLLVVAAETPYSAVIMDTKGKVTVEHGSKARRAGLGDLLYPGDTVETAQGAAITVNYVESGREEQWPENRKFSVGKTESKQKSAGVKVSDRKIIVPSLEHDRAGTLKLRGAAEKVEGSAADSSDKPKNHALEQYPTIEVNGLSNTSTLEERPTFRWNPVNLADTYVIALFTEETNGELWQTSATGPEAPYPQTAPPLRPNRHYRWSVEARRNGDVIARKMSCFYLPKKEELAVLMGQEKVFRDRLSNNPGDTATRLAFIFFLEENNLYDQAVEQYGILRNQRGESESIRAREKGLLQIRGFACE